MTHQVTIHLHNVPADQEGRYAAWFDGPHRDALQALPGFRSADRYEITPEQVMPDIAQPWRYLSLYEFDDTDLPALAAQLAEARAAGLVDDGDESERTATYAMYSDWVWSANHQPDQPLSGVSVILANFTPGQEPEYHHWYDTVHCPEVTANPGNVAMKRGKLAAGQLEPHRFVYGGELVLCALQSDDLGFTITDFAARANGVSPSGIAWAARSKAGSFARTVHYFRKISGTEFWPGGVAYAGDWSAYPGRG